MKMFVFSLQTQTTFETAGYHTPLNKTNEIEINTADPLNDFYTD